MYVDVHHARQLHRGLRQLQPGQDSHGGVSSISRVLHQVHTIWSMPSGTFCSMSPENIWSMQPDTSLGICHQIIIFSVECHHIGTKTVYWNLPKGKVSRYATFCVIIVLSSKAKITTCTVDLAILIKKIYDERRQQCVKIPYALNG
jgi:hypothetical protein